MALAQGQVAVMGLAAVAGSFCLDTDESEICEKKSVKKYWGKSLPPSGVALSLSLLSRGSISPVPPFRINALPAATAAQGASVVLHRLTSKMGFGCGVSVVA